MFPGERRVETSAIKGRKEVNNDGLEERREPVLREASKETSGIGLQCF